MTSNSRPSDSWMTKPTDRFILKWIKCTLSARITPRLAEVRGLRPWMITFCSMVLGILSGAFFSLSWGFFGGLFAAASQVMDGVDGQFARITGRASPAGAFLDSALDRYTDAAVVLGIMIYGMRTGADIHPFVALGVGFLALAGSGLISYTTARAGTLDLDLGAPTLASKGTRHSVMALSGLLSPLWAPLPFVALCYVAAHTNAVVIVRIVRAYGNPDPGSAGGV